MHIYPWQIDPTPSSKQALISGKPLHQRSFIYLPMAELPPPPSIGHRCLEYCYTKLGRSTSRSTPSIEQRCLEYCYTKLGISTGRSTPSQLSRDALHTATPNLTDLLADLPPSQLSIDALYTATPNLTDLLTDLPPVN